MSSKPMQRARLDGAELEFEVTATGEPVLLIHGAFIAEAYAPLCAEPALSSYSLMRYHRRRESVRAARLYLHLRRHRSTPCP
jgi:hypothetical protein